MKALELPETDNTAIDRLGGNGLDANPVPARRQGALQREVWA